MEISMGLKRTYVDSVQSNKPIKRISKEKIINKFIEKFPKVKLETVIKINKYCDQIDLNIYNEQDEQVEQIEQLIYYSLVEKIC